MNWNWNRNVCLVQLSNAATLTSSFQTAKNLSWQAHCKKWRKSSFLLSQTGEKREICHFHYTTWPDFGVPESPASFLNFLFKVRESGALGVDHGPAVVHCSAGIGRSGTFSLVDTCVVLVSPAFMSNIWAFDLVFLQKIFLVATIPLNFLFLFLQDHKWSENLHHSEILVESSAFNPKTPALSYSLSQTGDV